MFVLLFLAAGFFYLGYQPELNEIDVMGSLFGFNIQMSQYTLYGILIIILISLSIIIRFFVGIKNIYISILSFFTGRSKEKATENLLNAYAHLVGCKPIISKNYLPATGSGGGSGACAELGQPAGSQ